MQSRKMRTRMMRKRVLRKRARLQRMKEFISFSIGSYFVFHSVTEAADAVSAVEDAKNSGERLRSEARKIADYHKNIEYAADLEKAIAAIGKNLDELERERQSTEKDLADAWQWVQSAMEEQMHTEVATRLAEDALKSAPPKDALREAVRVEEMNIAAAQAEYDAAEAAQGRLQNPAALGDISEKEIEAFTLRELEKVSYDENRLEEVSDKVENYISGAEPSQEASAENPAAQNAVNLRQQRAQSNLDAAESALDAARERLEEREERETALREAQEDEKAARGDYAEARANLKNTRAYLDMIHEELKTSGEELREMKRDSADVQKMLEPLQDYKGMEARLRYFSWEDSKGKKGRQIHQPISFFQQEGDMEYGLQSGLVLSDMQQFADGKKSGWEDTTLSVAKKNVHDENTVTYGLDVNVPTGVSQMAAHAIIMDDLADVGRFGEGWNFTPRIRVDHKIGEEDTWSFMSSYGWKGSYEHDKALPDARVNPGNEWMNQLEWMHAGKKWQALAQLSHSLYGRTQENNTAYREGDYTDMALYYNRVLNSRQDLMGYYRYTTGLSSDYYTPINWEDWNGDIGRRYYGLEWKYRFSQDRALRVMGNVMLASGKNYDPLNQQYVDGRRKYGMLVGYDVNIDEKSNFSVDLERFYLKDGKEKSYHGWNVFLQYQRSF